MSIRAVATKHINAKDRAASHRLSMGMLPSSAMAYGALGMVEGHCKYGAYNYRVGGVKASVYIDALSRHTARWWNGQNNDPKSRVPHLASMLACVAIIIDAEACGVLIDDRPPKMVMDRIMKRFENIVKHLYKIYPNSPGRYTQREHGNVDHRRSAKKASQ